MHRRPQFEPLARLAAAGCGLSGPWGPRWVGLSCRTRTPGPLVLRWVHLTGRALLRRLCRRCVFGWLCPWVWVGAWPSSRVGAFALPGAAAAALPPGRVWVACPLGLGWVLGPVIGVDALRIRRTLMSAFPLKNNRPLSEGAAGYSRLGEGRCTHRSRLPGSPHGKSAPRSL